MSVNRYDYIVYGWKLESIKDSKGEEIDRWDEKLLPMIEGHEGEEFTLIFDQMSNEYVVFGLLVSNENDDSCGWEFVDLKIEQFNPLEIKGKFQELFGYIPEQEPKLFIFSHFS